MLKFKEICWSLLPLILICIFCNLWWNTRLLMQNSLETMKNVRDTSAVVKAYVEKEKARLEDPRNSNALDAAIQMGGVWNGVGRAVNTIIIPRLKNNADSANEATKALTNLIVQINKNSNDSFNQINSDILPQLGYMAENLNLIAIATGKDAKEINKELGKLLATGSLTLAELNNRLSDPKFDQLIEKTLLLQDGALELEREGIRTVDQFGQLGENLAKSTAELPTVMKRFRKFQPVIMGLNIAAFLRQIFIP